MQPDDITSRTFDGALHGYDKSQVREFLAQVANEHKAVVAKVEEAESTLEAVQSRLESLDELVRTSGERCRAAEDRIAELEGADARLAELEGRLASELDNARAQAAELEAVRAEAADLEAARARIASLESDLDEALLMAASAKPEDAAKQLGDEVTAVLQAAVTAGQAMRTEAETWADQLRRDVDKEVSEKLSAARAEVAELVARGEDRLEQLKASETTLRGWLHEAQSTIEHLLSEPETQVPVIQLEEPSAPEVGEWTEEIQVGSY